MSNEVQDHEIPDHGPRITPTDVEAAILACYYFNGADAHSAHWPDKNAMDPEHPSLKLLTICVLVLRNGFTVVGKSACASPENFNAEIGCRIAREDAVRQVWPLLGYALRDRLSKAEGKGAKWP